MSIVSLIIASPFFTQLNDVTSGGATIFPKLNLAVKPERGKVLHWYNMVRGSYDYEDRCQHAACPVIIGNKLGSSNYRYTIYYSIHEHFFAAMTQWIHERDQMFNKPCLKPPKLRKYY